MLQEWSLGGEIQLAHTLLPATAIRSRKVLGQKRVTAFLGADRSSADRMLEQTDPHSCDHKGGNCEAGTAAAAVLPWGNWFSMKLMVREAEKRDRSLHILHDLFEPLIKQTMKSDLSWASSVVRAVKSPLGVKASLSRTKYRLFPLPFNLGGLRRNVVFF